MKRVGRVFKQVTSFVALHAAAYRALRANRENVDALRFMHWLEPELLRLQRELESGSYDPGPYHTFTIWEPKERQIAAAPFRDRVVHHSVCAVLEPVFERRYVHDSYACRKDKGSHRAVTRAQRFARGNRYFLKCDVRKYFERIDHGVLKGILARLFKDRRFLDLLGLIVDHNAPHNAPGKGVPIGNLTSQHFANLYLDRLDHFVKEELRVKRYVRYMDDFLCLADSKDELHGVHGEVRAFLREQLQLELKDNKCYVAPVTQGVPFLGMRVFPGTVRLSRPSLVRCRRKLKRREADYARGRITELKRKQNGLEAELAKRTSIQQLPAHYSRPEYIESVRQELRGIFENGSHQLKKRYLNILLEEIVVDGDKVHVKPKGEGIIASLENSGRNGDGGAGKVIFLSDKWQPVCYTVYNFSTRLNVQAKRISCK